jgi:hypothetical protein
VRPALIWLLLFGIYAATLGIDAFGASDYGGDEPHYLLAAESIVSDGDVDLTDEYADAAYRDWYPYALDVHGRPTAGRLHEPHGLGYPALIAPAYALGGPIAAQLFMAAVAALGFVLAIRLARRLVPEPWATRGVLLVALSPPALAYGATVYPELTAGTMLVGATLLALRAREAPRWGAVCGAAVLLGALPWLGTKYAVPGVPVAAALLWWASRRGRFLMAIVAAEIIGTSALVYVRINQGLYGGLTPYAADVPGETATDASFPGGYLDRLPRLAGLWIDREYGIVRWAPILALAFLAAWLLWRSRRERVARALPERRDAEVAAFVLLGICAGQIAVAAFGAPTMFGFWFPGRHLVAALPAAAALTAWGLRHAPRTGAVLGALTLAASAWLLGALWLGEADGWVFPEVPAPWGPAEALFPLYGTGSAWAGAVAWAMVAALGVLAAREWRSWRQTAGMTRRAYSP